MARVAVERALAAEARPTVVVGHRGGVPEGSHAPGAALAEDGTNDSP